MLLNASQIESKLKGKGFHKLNQNGVDLSVKKIEKVLGGVMVLKDKTIVKPEYYEEVPTIQVDGYEVWRLEPGPYAVTFNEGVKIPKGQTGFINSRSSINRGGSMICSPLWDAGFECDEMGTTLYVNAVIFIEKNARIGQFYIHEGYDQGTVYNGQFQQKTNY